MNGSKSTDRADEVHALGWYGKVPGSGDFVTRRLPPAFLEPWDAWLRVALAGSRARLGDGWLDAFLSMPAWRFVLDPGIAGVDAWAGLLAPSVDSVGRYFPLTVACPLQARDACPVRTLWRARKWYAELESLVLGVLAPDGDRDAFDGELARRGFDAGFVVARKPAGKSASGAQQWQSSLWIPLAQPGEHDDEPEDMRNLCSSSFAGPSTVWLAEESEIFGRCLLLVDHLPSAEQFCALMNGKWTDHGWRTAVPSAAGHAGTPAATPAARESA